jgi:23S rRNA (uracil1939-C5)-methyltransferase
VKRIAKTGAGRVILVACDAASLGRDVKLLTDAGYTLTAATPVDLFPHTGHVEVVALLDG